MKSTTAVSRTASSIRTCGRLGHVVGATMLALTLLAGALGVGPATAAPAASRQARSAAPALAATSNRMVVIPRSQPRQRPGSAGCAGLCLMFCRSGTAPVTGGVAAVPAEFAAEGVQQRGDF